MLITNVFMPHKANHYQQTYGKADPQNPTCQKVNVKRVFANSKRSIQRS